MGYVTQSTNFFQESEILRLWASSQSSAWSQQSYYDCMVEKERTSPIDWFSYVLTAN